MPINVSVQGALPRVVEVRVAQRGLPGPDLRRASYSASTALSALRAVTTRPSDGTLAPLEPDLATPFVGITATSGPGSVVVVMNDWLEDPSWAWQIGPVYCGPGGTLTQSPGPIKKEVAYASGPTSIFVARGVLILET